MNIGKQSIAALWLVALPLTSPAWSTPMVDWSGTQSTYNGDGPWSMGFQFTTGASPVTIDALGAFDLNSDGFINPHQVGLWDAGGTLLTSATVTSADVLLGVGSDGHGFRYASIAPIILAANSTFVVGASDFGSGDAYAYDPIGASFDPSISYDTSLYGFGPGLSEPLSSSGVIGWFGANVQVSSGSAPEVDPDGASLPLACLALLMCASYRRKWRAQTSDLLA